MQFAPMDDSYGYTTPVTAIFSNSDSMTGFSIAEDGSFAAPLDVASESYFGCNSSLRGVERLALKFWRL